MTTAVPIFFKPVEYNSCKYVDGGLRGHFPIEECKSEKYLGIFIRGGTDIANPIVELFPIIEYMYSLMICQDQYVYDVEEKNINHRIIYINVNYGLKFEMNQKQGEEIIKMGYEESCKHLQKFKQHLVKDKA